MMMISSSTTNIVNDNNNNNEQEQQSETATNNNANANNNTTKQHELEEEQTNKEWVILLPPKLTKSSYAILVDSECVARPWHLQGRHGSRTHKDTSSGKIAIPVLSKSVVEHQAKLYPELAELLKQEGVEIVWKPFVPSNRAIARREPVFDATIHPERKPQQSSAPIHPSSVPPLSSSNSTTPQHNKHKFTYIDLFCGIGGFTVALEALGGKCLLACDIDEACQRLYKYNFPQHAHLLQGDIYEIKPTPAASKEKVDLLVGGFPCQPFSALGEQPGLDCPKGRGHLFLEIVRLLQIYKPSAFLLENVPGLLAMRETFDTILQSLRDAGYYVEYEICNARGLTATSRKRLFLVGFLQKTTTATTTSSTSTSTSTTTPTTTTNSKSESSSPPSYFQFPYIPDLQLRTDDIIDYTNSELTQLEQQHLHITNEQLLALSKNKKWRPAHLAWPNTTTSTLVSHYGNSITRGHSQLVPCSAHNSNSNPRRFTPRECLRIMGFPKDYKLPTKNETEQYLRSNSAMESTNNNATQEQQESEQQEQPQQLQGDMAWFKEQYRMIGNAVCPPIIAAIVGSILSYSYNLNNNSLESNCWEEYGRQVAIDLAYQATRSGRRTRPRRECSLNDDNNTHNNNNSSSNNSKKRKANDDDKEEETEEEEEVKVGSFK